MILKEWNDFLLEEGRIHDVKKKFPLLDKYGYIEELSTIDPSNSNKYLLWMAKQLNPTVQELYDIERNVGGYTDPPESFIRNQVFQGGILSKIENAVKAFNDNIQRIKKKDIYQYKTIQEVITTLKELGLTQRVKRKEKKQEAVEGSTILFENDDFLIIRPETQKASCFFGQSTKWCIAATKTHNYWNYYTDQLTGFVFVINKNLNSQDSDYKLSLEIQKPYNLISRIWDATDQSFEPDESYSFIRNLMAAVISPAFVQDYIDTLYYIDDIEHLENNRSEFAKIAEYLNKNYSIYWCNEIDSKFFFNKEKSSVELFREFSECLLSLGSGILENIEGIATKNIKKNPPTFDYEGKRRLVEEVNNELKYLTLKMTETPEEYINSEGGPLEYKIYGKWVNPIESLNIDKQLLAEEYEYAAGDLIDSQWRYLPYEVTRVLPASNRVEIDYQLTNKTLTTKFILSTIYDYDSYDTYDDDTDFNDDLESVLAAVKEFDYYLGNTFQGKYFRNNVEFVFQKMLESEFAGDVEEKGGSIVEELAKAAPNIYDFKIRQNGDIFIALKQFSVGQRMDDYGVEYLPNFNTINVDYMSSFWFAEYINDFITENNIFSSEQTNEVLFVFKQISKMVTLNPSVGTRVILSSRTSLRAIKLTVQPNILFNIGTEAMDLIKNDNNVRRKLMSCLIFLSKHYRGFAEDFIDSYMTEVEGIMLRQRNKENQQRGF